MGLGPGGELFAAAAAAAAAADPHQIVLAFRNSILGVFKTLQALARVPAKFRS